jgi:hypothetical protein
MRSVTPYLIRGALNEIASLFITKEVVALLLILSTILSCWIKGLGTTTSAFEQSTKICGVSPLSSSAF